MYTPEDEKQNKTKKTTAVTPQYAVQINTPEYVQELPWKRGTWYMYSSNKHPDRVISGFAPGAYHENTELSWLRSCSILHQTLWTGYKHMCDDEWGVVWAIEQVVFTSRFWAANEFARDEARLPVRCFLVMRHLTCLSRLSRGRPRPCSRRLPARRDVFVFFAK